MTEPVRKLKINIAQSLIMLVAILAIVGTVFCSSSFAQENGNGHEQKKVVDDQGTGANKGLSDKGIGLIAAAVAFGLGAVGAGFAISHVGAAAMGAVAEKPQVASQALIFVALAEGVVVFGFITAIMLINAV